MDLNDLSKIAADQDAGHEFDLVDPVHGKPVGIKLKVAGPDGEIARKARIEMESELSRLAKRKGGAGPEAREELVHTFLCAVVLDWNATEAGKPVPFSAENLLRLLRAGPWIRAQIDAFAGDRSPYFEKGA